MTDLEMTRLCAEAMGCKQFRMGDAVYPDSQVFDPLHNDTQAMALVKKFHLAMGRPAFRWIVGVTGRGKPGGIDEDLNRAIVECVAKMQAGKA